MENPSSLVLPSARAIRVFPSPPRRRIVGLGLLRDSSRKGDKAVLRSWDTNHAGMSRWLPFWQFMRYLLVGLWNTGFGYVTYAALTWVLSRHVAYGYLYAAVFSNIIAISAAARRLKKKRLIEKELRRLWPENTWP